MLVSTKRKHVAIDYDRRQIRLVVFEYVRKAPAIISLHTTAIPRDVDVADAAALGQFLKSLLEKLSLRRAKALMCVGRAQAVLKSLTLPLASDANEIASMVQFQTAQSLPFGAEEAVVDYTRGAHWDAEQTGAAAEGTTVLAAAVRLPVLDAARQICQEAGLNLQRLGLRPYANLRAVYHCVRMQPDERVVFVNLTADEAEIDVMRDETLEFSRAVPIASPDGETADEQDDEQRARTVRRAVTEVTRSLHSFHAVQRGGQVHACLVAGATGLESQLAAALSERLGVKCELFDPSGGFGVAAGPETSAFGAALGLAAGQAGDALPFDFLNPKRPAPPKDRRKIPAAVAGAVVVLLTSGLVLARTTYLAGHGEEIKTLKRHRTELVKANKQLKKLRDQVQAVRKWRDEQLNWLDQLAHLSNTLPGAEQVYLDSVKCSPGKIVLTGRARDRQSVSRFEKELMAMSGYKVRHGATGATRDDYGYGLKFDLEILISPEARPIVTTTRPAGRPDDDRGMRDPDRPGPAPQRRPRSRSYRNRPRR